MKYEVTNLLTKKALSQSLKRFMETKPFSKITVTEIVSDCGLNRKTFYYHFSDTRDLLKWTFEQDAIEVFRNFDLIIDYEDAVMFVMDYLESNRHMINCVYDSIGRDELKLFLYNDFFDIGLKIVSTAETVVGKKLSVEYKNLITKSFTEGVVGIIGDWIRGEIKYDKKTAVKYITDIFKNSLSAVINNSE